MELTEFNINQLKKFAKEKHAELEKEQKQPTCTFNKAYYLGYNHAFELVFTILGLDYDEIAKEEK